uniref:Uncharacterized protein n=1 Tax=Ditylenchus dipsaci TaxID=166011 RepID=A0A915DHG2_9BILA
MDLDQSNVQKYVMKRLEVMSVCLGNHPLALYRITVPPPAAATASSINNGYTNGYATTNGGTVNGDKAASQQPQAASNGNSSLKNGQNKSSSKGVSAPAAPVVFDKTPPTANVGPKKLEKNYSKLDGSQAEADLFKCFQEIRQILDKRESQLINQLSQCQQDGTRFCYDNSKLINDIAHLGEVVASGNDIFLCRTVFPILCLVSSVGETDSGLGQTSPVSQEKSVAQVDNGGIVMQSDALSADQLADLQRRIEETLRSQGIDPSVLSEFSSQSVAPRKRVSNKSNGGGGNRRDGDNRSDTSARNQKAKAAGEKQQQMKLSIFHLTAHGIDEEWKRVKYVLAIRELPGSHTAVHINAAIKKILEEWEIEQNRCHVFLRDGAANMKKAFEGLFLLYPDRLELYF